MIGAHVILCDDIREEVGHKVTLVGCYSGNLVLEGPLPATLAKLGVSVTWYQSPDEENLPVLVTAFRPGDADDAPIIRGEFNPADVPRRPARDGAPESERLVSMEMRAVISPITFTQSGVWRFYATRGGKRISIRRIDVISRLEMSEADAPTDSHRNRG